jgi:two-component system nitrogen regulation sensor histidine kinase NtrY
MGNQKISRRVLNGKNNHPRFTVRFGPVAVILALFIGLVSFLIFSGYTPIPPDRFRRSGAVCRQYPGILLVFGSSSPRPMRFSRRAARASPGGTAYRIVGLFSIIAAAPAC